MQLAARMKAAVEVLDEVINHHRPAPEALKDWGRVHRFAGSADRSAIGTLVFDVLRNKLSLAHRMGSDTTRALVLAATTKALNLSHGELSHEITNSQYGIEPLSDDEHLKLSKPIPSSTHSHISGDYPEWLNDELQRAFGDQCTAEGAALSQRAPIDLRVNTLKATREKVLRALKHYKALEAPLSPLGIRIPAPSGLKRPPNVEAETGHGKGWYELQDTASQVASLLTGAGPRMQVLDLCAGSGGKTLAMAAMMQNTGQIFAYDTNKFQLRPIFERVRRAGVRNLQVLDPGNEEALNQMANRFDVVLVDAPCSGSGTWRRRPDAKWRLSEYHLKKRALEQTAILELAANLVRPSGRLIYVTCSILPCENTDQVQKFLKKHNEYSILPYTKCWSDYIGNNAPGSADGQQNGLLLTPAQHKTDGFYIACLQKTS